MNNTLKDIGYLLIDNINQKTDSNKLKLFDKITKYNNLKKENEQKKLVNRNHYLITYQEPRIENDKKYTNYLDEKQYLYNKWIESKNVKDLYDFISLERPEYLDIPDVYTTEFNYKTVK